MGLLATSFKGNTKDRRATKKLMKWLMPWHAPTGAAGGQPEAATCARLTASSGPSWSTNYPSRVIRLRNAKPGAIPVIATGQINIGKAKKKKEGGGGWLLLPRDRGMLKNSFLNCWQWKVWVSNIIILKKFLISILMAAHWLQKFLLFQSKVVEISHWLFSLIKIL